MVIACRLAKLVHTLDTSQRDAFRLGMILDMSIVLAAEERMNRTNPAMFGRLSKRDSAVLSSARKLCNKYGISRILDEVTREDIAKELEGTQIGTAWFVQSKRKLKR